MSVPTITGSRSRGYSSSNAVTPSAPAPTDVIVTRSPSANPVATVMVIWPCGETRSSFGPNTATRRVRKNSDIAVMISMMPSVTATQRIWPVDPVSSWERITKPSAVPGKLPLANRRTIRQFTVPLSPCTMVPTLFVADAYSRSVPTAVAGWMPNTNISNGVINDPPPTPVCPTRRPTSRPETAKRRSTWNGNVIGVARHG